MKKKSWVLVLILCTGICFSMTDDVYSQFEKRNLVDYVNVSTGTSPSTAGIGCVTIGPQMPWGSVNPGPDVYDQRYGYDQTYSKSGYDKDLNIVGFSQTHCSGASGGYGNFRITPQIGLDFNKASYQSGKSEEDPKVGYYKVRLTKPNVLCELTPTHHSVIYKFTFPASDNSHLLIENCSSVSLLLNMMPVSFLTGNVTINAEGKKISGFVETSGNWGDPKFKTYFCAELSKPPTSYGTFKNGKAYSLQKTISIDSINEKIGSFFKFSTTKNEIIYLKISVSFVSTAHAEELLVSEIPEWDFNGVRKDCENKWNEMLSTILIDDPTITKDQMSLFYTQLYRCFNMPHNRTADNPNGWKGPYWDDYYCGWDTYRSLFPLLGILKQSFVRDNINSFIERFNFKGGSQYISDVYVAGNNLTGGWVQGGDNIDCIISDGYAKGISGVNWTQAYNIVKYNADFVRDKDYRESDKGWVPTSAYAEQGARCVSKTVEYNYNDFCTALMAYGLDKTNYNKYLKRSSGWETLFKTDKYDEGYSGFLQPRKTDMSWVNQDPDSMSYFYEGNSWVYSNYVPHNMSGLIAKMGGSEEFVNRLTYYMKNKHDATNEPSFLSSRLFNYALRPDLSSFYTRFVMEKWKLDIGAPGDDDSGAMASWYIFAALGFYPSAGNDVYLINGPMFKKFTIQMENGKNIVINGPFANEANNKYIESVAMNGKSLEKAWFRHNDINNGAVLTFTMGSEASNWGKTIPPPSGKEIITNSLCSIK